MSPRPTRTPVHVLMVLFAALAFLCLAEWSHAGINSTTGDEPHYVVMAQGILRHHTFDVAQAYIDEVREQRIYPGLGDPARPLESIGVHIFPTAHGWFSIHAEGLPLLLVVPFGLGWALGIGGLIGSKIMMVLLGSLIPLLAWQFASRFGGSVAVRVGAVAAVVLCYPFIPASTQIYPNLPCGLFALAGLWWIYELRRGNRPGPLAEAATVAGIATLVWAQLTFGPAAFVLLSAAVYSLWRNGRRRSAFVTLGAVGTSFALWAAFQMYAYGSLNPYSASAEWADAAKLDMRSVMVAFGLELDQNQGFLIQNPIMLLGLVGIGMLFKRDVLFGFTWLATYALVVGPFAIQSAWYGAWSYSGRFSWAGACVFVIPTLLALISLATRFTRIFWLIVTAGILLQLYHFKHYGPDGVQLFRRPGFTPQDHYSILYARVDDLLPMFYQVHHIFDRPQNWIWVAIAMVLLVAGFVLPRAQNPDQQPALSHAT